MPHRDPPDNPSPSAVTPISADDSTPSHTTASAQKVLLTIAGFDPSNGAGITADLQTFAAHGFFGTSAATSLTVQSTRGVFASKPVTPDLLRQTLTELTQDLPPAGIKIGMLAAPELAHVTFVRIQALNEELTPKLQIPIVFDPVITSSSGHPLYPEAALETLHNGLIQRVSWITPNWLELAALTGLIVESINGVEEAIRSLAARHPHLHIVATGGDHAQPTDVLRLPTGEIHHFHGTHIESRATHGTGCAFSSALLCRLVLGDEPLAAVTAAKCYVTQAILRAPNLGHGKGPMNLLWPLQN